MSRRFELIELTRSGEEYSVRCAYDGKLAVPFTIHVSDVNRYQTEPELFAMLERQAATLVHSYGDAREMRLSPISEEAYIGT